MSENNKKNGLIEGLKFFILLNIAVFFIAVAVRWFFQPHDIAAGGLGGLAVILNSKLDIPIYITSAIGQLILLVIGGLILGREFLLKTILGSLLFPIYTYIVPLISVTNNELLSVFYGSLFDAVGIVLIYKIGASSGGTTIPPLIFKKLFNLRTAIGLFISDGIIVLLGLFAFGLEKFLLAGLVITLTSVMITFIENNITKRRAVYIISSEYQKIMDAIINEINRGVTLIPTYGGYTKEQNNMIMVVVAQKDYVALRKLIDRYDEKAFVLTNNVSEVYGLGFSFEDLAE
jgi:uncharacterized membrane-anchored protein YitT (DUF2179 family)